MIRASQVPLLLLLQWCEVVAPGVVLLQCEGSRVLCRWLPAYVL